MAIPTVAIVIPPIQALTNTGDTLETTVTITPMAVPTSVFTIENTEGIFIPEQIRETITEYPHTIEVINIAHPSVSGDSNQYAVEVESETAYFQAIITLTPESTTIVIG